MNKFFAITVLFLFVVGCTKQDVKNYGCVLEVSRDAKNPIFSPLPSKIVLSSVRVTDDIASINGKDYLRSTTLPVQMRPDGTRNEYYVATNETVVMSYSPDGEVKIMLMQLADLQTAGVCNRI
jgi:hypothetical protein